MPDSVPPVQHMTYLQAIVIGLIQGLYELFPLSSLGHTVLIPSWIGGSWASLVRQESQPESPYLSFVVALHLANALALLAFYLREWGAIIGAFVTSVVRRRVETDRQKVAWLIVLATIPVGILGLLLEHTFRTLFAKPLAAALFLMANGVLLAVGEAIRRRRPPEPDGPHQALVEIDADARHDIAAMGVRSAVAIGTAQTLALFAGISREGVVLVGGLARGLSRETALRFAFLLSTPVIVAAGLLKVPDLTGPLGAGIHGQIAAGAAAAVVSSFVAIFLVARFFARRGASLTPFAVYSVLFGAASAIRFGLF